jgi:carbon-monoxide dehydrogenase large subunit
VLANPDPLLGSLTLWSSTQLAHELRSVIMRVLDLDENRLRVVTPDVGGGFGAKYLVYAEEAAIAAAALISGKPLKWVEDRREHFLAALQERDQDWKIEVAYDRDGRLLGARGHLFNDQGAYTPQGINIAYNAATAFPGPYVLPAYDMLIHAVSTNKVPTSSVRGAGYPQGTFAMERALDRIADKLGISRVDIRRRNLIGPDRMPYATPLKSRSGASIIYDSGDFPKVLDTALELIDYAGFPERQARARAEGRLAGIGVACGIKGTGRGPYESGTVRIGPSGKISIYTGASEMGQGIKSALAQICARQLGVLPNAISVVAGDTGTVPLGMGGFASRQTVTAGSSVHLAASAVRAKVLLIASHMLEAAVEDLEIEGGAVHLKGVSEMRVTLREVAAAVYGSPGYSLPEGIGPGLESDDTFLPKGLTYGMGCHAVELELDQVTWAPKITRYIVVNDAGVLINPTIVEGQIIGGVAHGIGNALYEWMGFDANGQPFTTTLAEYLLPTSTEVPRITVKAVEYPSTTNPLGVKGVGESGVLPAAGAIISAIENAVGRPDFHIDDIPLSPDKLFSLIQQVGH